MRYRQLGKNGPTIPVIMLGGYSMSGDMGDVHLPTAVDMVRRCLDVGITAIDTAENYKLSQDIIGRALVGHRRQHAFIATKVSFQPFTRGRVEEALENSLRALRTDYVDLYQLHSYPKEIPLEQAMASLVWARESGKARYLGVSNFNAEQMAAAHRICPIDSVQPQLSMFRRQNTRELLPLCARIGIGSIVYGPLDKGMLAGRFRRGHTFGEDDGRRHHARFEPDNFERFVSLIEELKTIADEKGIPPVQLAIAWVLSVPGVTAAIAGARTPEQVEEQAGAAEVELTPEDLARIDAIAARSPLPII